MIVMIHHRTESTYGLGDQNTYVQLYKQVEANEGITGRLEMPGVDAGGSGSANHRPVFTKWVSVINQH